jgi:hypothetical protein
MANCRHILALCLPILVIIQSIQAKKIAPSQIASIQLVYDTSQIIIPNQRIAMGIVVTTKNNETYATRGYANGNLSWGPFQIDCIKGNYFFRKFHFGYDPFLIHTGEIYLNAHVKKAPDIRCSKVVPLNYETEVKIFPASAFQKAPGEKVKMAIVSHFNNGKELWAIPYENSPLELDHYTYQPFGGRYHKGYFHISNDVKQIVHHQAGVLVSPKTNPLLTSTFLITLDYRKPFRHFADGRDGMDGSFGTSGPHGSNGSAGCHGGHGSYGGPGSDGYDGHDGHDLDIYVDCYWDTLINQRLLKVLLNDLYTHSSKHYLINVDGGTLNVFCRGGDGGDGGNGGNGGDGGDGGPGRRETIKEKVNDSTFVEKVIVHRGGDGGYGGDGGPGGNGGNGGDGGWVNLYTTVEAEPYLHILYIDNQGGLGGDNGNGGSAGRGGSSGSGNPSGWSGKSGSSGFSGSSGYYGRDGRIRQMYIDRLDW